MDWEWIKAFPEALKGQFKAMKITVNWEKAWLRCLSLSWPVYRCC
ncbi:potassium efflux system KefA protein / Small-conductance mechanosensitive channel [Klebsiella pneumoniae]|uniref:Potassium efflux system KefA protein / Small-conductance mechanosensitive channel n=1 Tax=Klebsiella pneumoniae TaxID=573 RepID=A0A2X3C6N6_KLEPN|nr:potassium efflux system KefA protein / Small-conductance mechanosensitive channel [Klebsiella pneumoniae]